MCLLMFLGVLRGNVGICFALWKFINKLGHRGKGVLNSKEKFKTFGHWLFESYIFNDPKFSPL